ncbi:Unknown protein sequence [Pseudomonas syringae pv. maculicola]|nr:Unknown protein sequence [Pseudomonas savastanoi pv. phaseolicola]KPB61787.1 Unknown protein sequence [Pseudomonas amygdali pv. mellea]KPB87854.1 Unknown protein sequence [Pseudomonas syringae pv. maculicola]KPB36003.1 Unknown protein sequence [Pseudomonas savastanoi pv. phaseolicola]KPB39735.1 Unknown protein sequence [Pseudomonas savastanoi pv. phaseolicola]
MVTARSQSKKPEQRPANIGHCSADAPPFFFEKTSHYGTPLLGWKKAVHVH